MARLEPHTGLKALLTIDDDLHRQIDTCAIDYEGGIHPKHRLTNYHQFFVQRVREGEKVLDIGCGNGAVAYSLAKAGASVTGVDLCEDNIRTAVEKYQHPGLNFIMCDATRDLPSDPFDIVILSNVLEHIEHRVEFLLNIQKKVPALKYLIRVPMLTRDWLILLKKELGLPYFCDPDHYVEYTLDSFKSEMAQARLSVKHYEINWGEIWAEVDHA
jgi:SAM-dependent methyltransferase